MQKVLTAEQMREVDRLTTERYGIPSILLMENAAHAVARVITERLGGTVKGKSILILCGSGNNGGDGAALARILAVQGAYIDVLLFGKIKETRGDARINFGVLCREEVEFEDVYMSNFGELGEIQSQEEYYEFYLHTGQYCDVFVDAIFGTGLTRPLDLWLYNIIHDINFANEGPTFKPRLTVAVDIPTGLNADSDERFAEPIRADITVSFTAPKPGNVLPNVAALNGELIVADIGSPEELIDAQPSHLYLAERSDAEAWLRNTEFSSDSYKNKRGHAFLIAGSESYSGAAVLCADAAMRSGVGLVTIATPKSSKDSVASRVLPEVIVRGVSESESGAIAEAAFAEIGELLEKTDAVAIGSGISQDESTKKFVERVIENRQQPIVVDADAINLLSPFAGENHPVGETPPPLLSKEGSLLLPLILTPHEGEFLRLLGTTDKDVLHDCVAAVRQFALTHNVILVLKGERVLIGEPSGRVVVNPTGNSGLGKAGNGDTLTGILVGFVAQAVQFKRDIFETVVAAVYVAGMAGDLAEQKYGKRVMTASDVRECLSEVFSNLEGS
ncbi:MAG: NAD(P)H-hydrate dehydratase [Pyrinomonadaceae bacterium]